MSTKITKKMVKSSVWLRHSSNRIQESVLLRLSRIRCFSHRSRLWERILMDVLEVVFDFWNRCGKVRKNLKALTLPKLI